MGSASIKGFFFSFSGERGFMGFVWGQSGVPTDAKIFTMVTMWVLAHPNTSPPPALRLNQVL